MLIINLVIINNHFTTSLSSVTSTQTNKNNWWKVNLGTSYNINLVIVYGNIQSPERINGAQVNG